MLTEPAIVTVVSTDTAATDEIYELLQLCQRILQRLTKSMIVTVVSTDTAATDEIL